MVILTSATPSVKSAQERVLKGSGVAEKKTSERQRLKIRRQTESVLERAVYART